MFGRKSWSVERDPRVGTCNKVKELEGATKSRSQIVKRGHVARSWNWSGCNKFGKLCLLLYQNSVQHNFVNNEVWCVLQCTVVSRAPAICKCDMSNAGSWRSVKRG